MKITLIAIIISLGLTYITYSQTPTLTLENDTAMPCHIISIDLYASDFPDNVGAITLYIDYDANILEFFSSTSGTIPILVNSSSPGRVEFFWYDLSGANINGVIATMHFHYQGDYTIIDFDEEDPQFDVADISLNPIEFNCVNGSADQGTYNFRTFYVDAAKPGGGDGLSWGTAFNSITTAINQNLKPGEKVLVKPGTYNEKITIKSQGGYAITATAGVILSDTNKITFPSGTNLSCVDLTGYPDQYYAYIYRSLKSNNGYYKIIEVNDAQDYVRVEGASFCPESGSAGDFSNVSAAVGRPVLYLKDPASLPTERVVVSYSSGGSAYNIVTIDNFNDSTRTNFNIIDGFDITGVNTTGGNTGLYLFSSSYNVFTNGRIYNTNGLLTYTNGCGAYLTGSSPYPSNYNIIQKNIIYNTAFQAVLMGHVITGSSNNNARYNHIVDNEIYLTGSTNSARFNSVIRISRNNPNNVIEGNLIRDVKLFASDNGVVNLAYRSHNTLVYGNIIRNIDRNTTSVLRCASVMIDTAINNTYVFNNLIYNDDTLNNSMYAFNIFGKSSSNTYVAFNTIYKIDSAFYLRDLGAPSTVNIHIKNNIINPARGYFTNIGTAGRYTVTHNLYRNSFIGTYSSTTGVVIGDPLFYSPDVGNPYGLRLQTTSPCFNAGTPITGLTSDYLVRSRSLATPTIGAFETALTDLYWTGNVSTDWFNTGNWDMGFLPTGSLNVIIPDKSNDPLINGLGANCKTCTLETGATLNVINSQLKIFN